jgi:tRNA threonylcarbamoyladenosine biosynthesis protein TsaB
MKEPTLLHIETSGPMCSVALSKGNACLALVESSEKYDHSSSLAPFIVEVLSRGAVSREALDGVSVSAGPGSFTGLRVGVSTAKALCFALDCPLIAVDSLYAFALAAMRSAGGDGIYYPVVDARRMELYIAAYDADGERLMDNTSVIVDAHLFDDLLASGERVVLCGTGTSKCIPLLEPRGVEILALDNSAEHLIAPAYRAFLANAFADLRKFTPGYIKAPNITTPRTPHILED